MCRLNDKISVIIPSLKNHSNLKPLLDDISAQSIKNIDIQIVKGVSPNGKARNIGAAKAVRNICIFWIMISAYGIIEYLKS